MVVITCLLPLCLACAGTTMFYGHDYSYVNYDKLSGPAYRCDSFLEPAKSPSNSDQIGDEWPMFCGALNHTGTITTTPVSGPGILWDHGVGGSLQSSPAIMNGYLFVGDSNDFIYCLNATTGAQIWSSNTSWAIWSTPAIVGDRLFACNFGGIVDCLNITTGTQIWNCSANGGASSPAVAYGCVFVSGDGVYCLNATTGIQIWHDFVGYCGVPGPSPAVGNGCVYIGPIENETFCLNASTGAIIWSFATGGEIYSSPTIADGEVLFGCDDGNVYCLNATTGVKAWAYLMNGSVWSTPAVFGDRVIVSSSSNSLNSGGAVYCLKIATGYPIWTYLTGNYVTSSAVVAGSRVFVVDGGDNIYCLNEDTGAWIWNDTLTDAWNPDFWTSSPAVAAGRVYEPSYDGHVYCLPMTFPPSSPLLLTTIANTSQVTLSWHVPASNGGAAITGYNIYRGSSPGDEVLLNTIGNVTSWSDRNITLNQRYYYEVSALNAAGESLKSAEQSATPKTSSNFISGYQLIYSTGLLVIMVSALVITTLKKIHYKAGISSC